MAERGQAFAIKLGLRPHLHMGLHRYSIASPTTLLLRLRLLDSKAVSSAGLLNHAHLPAAAAAAAPRYTS